jgi:hypothetical protein
VVTGTLVHPGRQAGICRGVDLQRCSPHRLLVQPAGDESGTGKYIGPPDTRVAARNDVRKYY